MKKTHLSQELRSMVKWSVAILGEVILKELGKPSFLRIEKTRRMMAKTRGKKPEYIALQLRKTDYLLAQLSSQERLDFAKSFTLMLELMNACENAYRTYRLGMRKKNKNQKGAEAIYFVLTAHPTEARSPENIQIFHQIQKILTLAFARGVETYSESLKSMLQLAWKTEIVRMRKPRVQDEAEHIYSILLRDSNLSTLLDFGGDNSPVYIRSWVGGDKDGHPGVDEEVMTDSLQMSRNLLCEYLKKQVQELRQLIHSIGNPEPELECLRTLQSLKKIRRLKEGDLSRVMVVHQKISNLVKIYEKTIGSSFPPPLARLKQLIHVFPGLVVPLELREDSSILMSDPSGDSLAIGRMLTRIGSFSKGGDPCLYARGMIISMAQSVDHVKVAGKMILRHVGNSKIPVVPLFEQKSALDSGAEIISNLLKDQKIRKIINEDWGGVVEIMVGYSDSAKESGVISSRFSILESIKKLESTCRKRGVKAVFFHGSGGSVDRGGGSIRDQIAGWPKNAMNVYKATVQGEMVERTFSSPEILESQLAQISEMTDITKQKSSLTNKNLTLTRFANLVRDHYRTMVENKNFLEMIETSTPYSYLSALKIGSRPSKRTTGGLSVSGLRAIPWVLCWTQTRILFPTWWGVGMAWGQLSKAEKKEIKDSFNRHPVFKSFIHALGFTLAKIELPVFEYYLRSSKLGRETVNEMILKFRRELSATQRCFYEITGEKNYLWFRPWLGESIELRAPMIHPLNLLQMNAQKEKDLNLLRVSVTGIASGMLTTG
jgi:phosphoenolpyruvate carboxylase